jgi:hypothetical protein
LRITCQLKTVRRLASLQLGSVWDFNGQRKAPNMAKCPEKNQSNRHLSTISRFGDNNFSYFGTTKEDYRK